MNQRKYPDSVGSVAAVLGLCVLTYEGTKWFGTTAQKAWFKYKQHKAESKPAFTEAEPFVPCTPKWKARLHYEAFAREAKS